MVSAMIQRMKKSKLFTAFRLLCMLLGPSVIVYIVWSIKRALARRKLKRKYDCTRLRDSYEYIVCGAGSAGCVVARRLAEAGHTTLLIEAGQNDEGNSVVSTPIMCPATQQTNIDWQYQTVQQGNSSQACRGRKHAWPRGKILGGSSNLNYMVYMRGQPGDFNLWGRKYGCKGWDWKDVLPYYMKSENNNRPRPGHASGGLLGVSDLNTRLSITANLFVESCRTLGMNEGEMDGADPLGAFRHQFTIRHGRRQSSSHCFIHGAWSGKENLDIITSAHVLKINFEPFEPSGFNNINHKVTAMGVRIQRGNGKQIDVRASRETILCGGAIGSPQILMCSGVGRKDDLQELGIPVIYDSPEVGKNLQDHLFTTLIHRIKTEQAPIITKESITKWDILEYQLFGEGIFTSNGLEATAYVKHDILDQIMDPVLERNVKTNSIIHEDPGVPPVQLHFVSGTIDPVTLCKHTNMDERYLTDTNHVKNTCAILAVLCHPHSRGTIKLKSSNPLEYPLIDPKYLSDDRDIETIIKSVILMDKITKTKPFSNISHGEHISYYRDEVTRFEEDGMVNTDAWRAAIRRYSRTIYHPVGTCRMGEDPKTSVCDSKLRVHGICGLRVADLSICPGLTSGNTNAPAMMIGERCADFILSSISL